MDKVIETIINNNYFPILLLLVVGLLCISVIGMYFVAIRQGREVTLWPPKIGPSQAQNPPPVNPAFNHAADNSENFSVVDIMKAHNLWADFEGTFYAWNPSWQTEIITNPVEWSEIHVNRYLDSKIDRVIYVILNNSSKRKDRKYYYLDGFKLFLSRFLTANPGIENKVKDKMEVYMESEPASDLTFFVGHKQTDDSKVGLLLINEEPFCHGGTPILAFETKNERIIGEMMKMFHDVMTSSSKCDLGEILSTPDMSTSNLE
ncbi:MAG: hypothetical protein ABW092_11370 [Candidatus Thiodiazotropha sp.]